MALPETPEPVTAAQRLRAAEAEAREMGASCVPLREDIASAIVEVLWHRAPEARLTYWFDWTDGRYDRRRLFRSEALDLIARYGDQGLGVTS